MLQSRDAVRYETSARPASLGAQPQVVSPRRCDNATRAQIWPANRDSDERVDLPPLEIPIEVKA